MPLDPLKLKSDTVVLIGMAETSRHLAPWDDPDCEIWAINESYHPHHTKGLKKGEEPKPFLKRWDRWFQIHPRWDFMREGNFNHPNHPLWLTGQKGTCYVCKGHGKMGDKVCKECSGTGEYDPAIHRRFEMDYPFPIYTINEEQDVPGSTPYPLIDIIDSYGVNARNVRYFTNSFGIMVALALHMGAKCIKGYGWEMSSKTEYGDQKPNANFWAGVCIGKGVEFFLPPGCSMLGDLEQLYGFEKVPGITKMHMEIQVNALEKAFAKAQAELNMLRGEKTTLINRSKATKGMTKEGQEKAQKELTALVNKEFAKISEMNSLFGALQQTKRIHAEVAMLHSIAQIGFVNARGDRETLDLAEFERSARVELEEQAGTGLVDDVEIAKAGGLDPYGE